MALRILTSMALLLAALILPGMALGQEKKGKLNIVVFISDDHGFHDSPVFGSKQVRTPNMQRIAKAGAAFSQVFVASPSCAPSRAALLTGLMPARNGAEANHSAPRQDLATLPMLLRRLGFTVAAFGKVAHGKLAPNFGFDHVNAKHDQATVAAFLKAHDPAKPLCLFVGTNHPHVPWPEIKDYDPAKIVPPPNLADTAETRHFLAKYYTAVTQMDQELGEVFDLARTHLQGDTLFLYLSDHGAQWPFGKWNLYDAGIRVPMLAVWPGRIAPNSRVDAMISTVDLLPTFLEVAGGKAPAGLDGLSFASVLTGKAREHRKEIFTTHTNDGRFNIYPIRSVRTRDFAYVRNLHPDWAHTTHIDLALAKDGLKYWTTWKAAAKTDAAVAALVKRYHQRPREELYDLRADPWQLRDLAADAKHADRLQAMRQKLDVWMKTQNDEDRVLVAPRLLSDPASWQTPIKQAPKKKPG